MPFIQISFNVKAGLAILLTKLYPTFCWSLKACTKALPYIIDCSSADHTPSGVKGVGRHNLYGSNSRSCNTWRVKRASWHLSR